MIMLHPYFLGLLMLNKQSSDVWSIVQYEDKNFVARMTSFGTKILNIKNQFLGEVGYHLLNENFP